MLRGGMLSAYPGRILGVTLKVAECPIERNGSMICTIQSSMVAEKRQVTGRVCVFAWVCKIHRRLRKMSVDSTLSSRQTPSCHRRAGGFDAARIQLGPIGVNLVEEGFLDRSHPGPFCIASRRARVPCNSAKDDASVYVTAAAYGSTCAVFEHVLDCPEDSKSMTTARRLTVARRLTDSKRSLLHLNGHSRVITSVAFAPDTALSAKNVDYVVATSSLDRTMKIWHISRDMRRRGLFSSMCARTLHSSRGIACMRWGIEGLLSVGGGREPPTLWLVVNVLPLCVWVLEKRGISSGDGGLVKGLLRFLCICLTGAGDGLADTHL